MRCDKAKCYNTADRASGASDRNVAICNPCLRELIAMGPTTDIDQFMNVPKLETERLDASRAYFEAIFCYKVDE